MPIWSFHWKWTIRLRATHPFEPPTYSFCTTAASLIMLGLSRLYTTLIPIANSNSVSCIESDSALCGQSPDQIGNINWLFNIRPYFNSCRGGRWSLSQELRINYNSNYRLPNDWKLWTSPSAANAACDIKLPIPPYSEYLKLFWA